MPPHRDPTSQPTPMGCCLFLRWPVGYHRIAGAGEKVSSPVRVVVGKEKRVFFVDSFVLDKYPFRVLMEMVRNWESKRKDAIFVDVDAILFEHLLWLVCDDRSRSSSSTFLLNLREIIEFYSQDN
ncbi:uncharacterized protein [Typha angustifolia]|uniref:uncharacterized protein n=1 Tax=Typha angustifolia TaxID=59011 RepID=UPI003C2BC752